MQSVGKVIIKKKPWKLQLWSKTRYKRVLYYWHSTVFAFKSEFN